MYKLVLEKTEEAEIKLPTSAGSLQKQENSRKTSALSILPKPLTLWITTNCQKFSKKWNTRPPYLPPEKSVSSPEAIVRTEHGTTDWFQIGKGVHEGRIWLPCLFNLYAEYIM